MYRVSTPTAPSHACNKHAPPSPPRPQPQVGIVDTGVVDLRSLLLFDERHVPPVLRVACVVAFIGAMLTVVIIGGAEYIDDTQLEPLRSICNICFILLAAVLGCGLPLKKVIRDGHNNKPLPSLRRASSSSRFHRQNTLKLNSNGDGVRACVVCRRRPSPPAPHLS